jgi:hypothetical protein
MSETKKTTRKKIEVRDEKARAALVAVGRLIAALPPQPSPALEALQVARAAIAELEG